MVIFVRHHVYLFIESLKIYGMILAVTLMLKSVRELKVKGFFSLKLCPGKG
jgi:hypothetical protein